MSAPHFFQKSIFRSVGAFARDRAGNIAIMFAVSILPLTIAVGAAMDYGNGLNVKAKLQGAIDAGLLKAATDPTLVVGGSPACATVTSCNIQIEHAVRDATRAYYASYQGMTPTVSTTFSGGDISATASVTQPTGIMKIVGKSSMAISVNAEVKRGTMGGAEVALVLDTTGSMASPKIDALKTAATQFVTALLPSGSSNKVALVPFDMYVNVGLSNRGASWITGAYDYTVAGPDSCTTTWSIATPGTPVWTPATCTNDGISSDCSYWYTPMTYSGSSTTTCTPTSTTYTWQGCVGSREQRKSRRCRDEQLLRAAVDAPDERHGHTANRDQCGLSLQRNLYRARPALGVARVVAQSALRRWRGLWGQVEIHRSDDGWGQHALGQLSRAWQFRCGRRQ
jgi:Flp pilus assembly protein TadG